MEEDVQPKELIRKEKKDEEGTLTAQTPRSTPP